MEPTGDHLPRRKSRLETERETEGAKPSEQSKQASRGGPGKPLNTREEAAAGAAVARHGVARTHACMELDKMGGRQGQVEPMALAQTPDAHEDETRSFNRRLRADACEDTRECAPGFPLGDTDSTVLLCGAEAGVTSWDVLKGREGAKVRASKVRTSQHQAGRQLAGEQKRYRPCAWHLGWNI